MADLIPNPRALRSARLSWTACGWTPPGSAVSTLDDRREPDAPARRPFDEAELRTLLSVAKGE